MKIIITGPKASGKSTIAALLAGNTGIPHIDLDAVMEEHYLQKTGTARTFREIYQTEGAEYFRNLESEAAASLEQQDWCIIATGGSSLLSPDIRESLLPGSVLILLKIDEEEQWNRITADGVPSFLDASAGAAQLTQRNLKLYEAVEHRSDIVYTVNSSPESTTAALLERLTLLFTHRMTGPNTFGEIIRTTTFGESHGAAVGAVLDGIPPGIPLSEEDIQIELDRRRPGQSSITTPRKESDTIHFLSGVFEGKTTGTPLCMVVYNSNQNSSHYDSIKDLFRPGHADLTFWKKYGLRDHRGGGRSSGRETVGRVASGAVAKKLLSERGISITAWTESIASVEATSFDKNFIEENPVRAACRQQAKAMEEEIARARNNGKSVGGMVRFSITGVAAGLGDPVFYKLDARLSMAFFSIGAVKAVEIGSGFDAASMSGDEHNDEMEDSLFLSNNAGGILGGISNGNEITGRIAVKPTPSISLPQKTMDIHGNNRTIETHGRHDPCIVPRIIPVVESMAALVLLDALKLQEQMGKG